MGTRSHSRITGNNDILIKNRKEITVLSDSLGSIQFSNQN